MKRYGHSQGSEAISITSAVLKVGAVWNAQVYNITSQKTEPLAMRFLPPGG